MVTHVQKREEDASKRKEKQQAKHLNMLLAHSERQAEEARTHAGNLAHALKTPLTVVNNAATAQAPAHDAGPHRDRAGPQTPRRSRS